MFQGMRHWAVSIMVFLVSERVRESERCDFLINNHFLLLSPWESESESHDSLFHSVGISNENLR
jgi:hypothetical protein